MSSLSSASTLTEIENSYLDNASYEEDASVTKAKAFVTACRMLLMKWPALVSQGGNQLQLNAAGIKAQLERAQAYVAANGSSGTAGQSGSVKHPSFATFR